MALKSRGVSLCRNRKGVGSHRGLMRPHQCPRRRPRRQRVDVLLRVGARHVGARPRGEPGERVRSKPDAPPRIRKRNRHAAPLTLPGVRKRFTADATGQTQRARVLVAQIRIRQRGKSFMNSTLRDICGPCCRGIEDGHARAAEVTLIRHSVNPVAFARITLRHYCHRCCDIYHQRK